MQPELHVIDFANQAEVRSKAEYRRTEEMTALLKTLFNGWMARLRRWERPVFDAVSPSRASATAGK